MKKRIFSLIILYVFLFSNSVSYAASREEVENYLYKYTINFLTYISKDPKAEIQHTDVIKGGMSYSFVTPITDKGTNKTYYYGTPEMFCRTMYAGALGHEFKYVPVPSGQVNYGRSNTSLQSNPEEVLKPDTENGKRGDDFEIVGYYPPDENTEPPDENTEPPDENTELSQKDILKWYDATLKPGDILECFHHTMIYLGTVKDGKGNDVKYVMANMRWRAVNTDVASYLPRGLFSLERDRDNGNYTEPGMHYTIAHKATGLVAPGYACYLGSKNCSVRAWRLTDAAIAKLDSSLFNSGDKMQNATYYEMEDIMDLSMFEDADKMEVSKFYYNGIPDGKYSVTRSIFQMIIDNFGQIFDYLVGIATMWVRMIFVGWAAIIEKLINVTMTAVSGGQDVNSVKVNATEVDTGDAVNIEKIIFNEVSIFDVNFFNFNDEKEEAEK